MPTASAPQPRSMRTSAGVSYVGPSRPDVDALGKRDAFRPSRVVEARTQVRRPRSVWSGKRGPIASALRPQERRQAGHVDVVRDHHERPARRTTGSSPPAALVRTIDGGAETAHEQDRLDDEARLVSLVERGAGPGASRPAPRRAGRAGAGPHGRAPSPRASRGGRRRGWRRRRRGRPPGRRGRSRGRSRRAGPGPSGRARPLRARRGAPGGRQVRCAGRARSSWDHHDVGRDLRHPTGVPTPGCRSRPAGRPTRRWAWKRPKEPAPVPLGPP